MEYNIEVSDTQIDDVLNQCAQSENTGSSKFPGMTYEQGVKYAIKWMIGDEPNPLDE